MHRHEPLTPIRRPLPRLTRRLGFTLVELLVVIGIIAVLVGILLPTLAKARESAYRIQCGSNLRQLMLGMIMHANEHKRGWYVKTPDFISDSLESVIPKYIKDGKVAICPGTRNRVDMTVTSTETKFVDGKFMSETFFPHIRDKAKHASDDSGGHSYEVFAWAGEAEYPDGLKLLPRDPKDIENPQREHLLTIRKVRKPQEVFLLLDRDEPLGSSINNWPDKGDNHGEKGLNLGFCDGHVEFVDRAGMVRAMLKSRHPWPRTGGDLGPALKLIPGLKNTGGWKGKWYYE